LSRNQPDPQFRPLRLVPPANAASALLAAARWALTPTRSPVDGCIWQASNMEIQQPKDSQYVNAGAVFNKKGSKRRRKAVMSLAKVHQYIFHQRNDHQHQLARRLVNQFGKIFVEDLSVQGLSRGMLSKAVNDASWAFFRAKLAYKAEEAGRQLVKVDHWGTSQCCLCGAKVPKKLSDREHVCTQCGLIGTRDQVSAMEILRFGLSLQPLRVGAITPPWVEKPTPLGGGKVTFHPIPV